MRALTICGFVALITALQAAQQPTFRTGTNLVQVDALVSDGSGNPASDLTADDFEITDDGTPAAVTAFRFVSADAAQWRDDAISPIRTVDDEAREAALDGVRVFAIFLDEYHVTRGNAFRAVPALVQFVRTLPAADLVAVYGVMDSVRDVRYTRDRAPVLQRIQVFAGRMGDYFPPKYPAEEEHLRHPRDIETLRTQVSDSALEAIVTHLGAISDRRKSLILVAEKVGFASSLTDSAEYLLGMIGAANRVNVSLYPVDPGGLRVGVQRTAGMPPIEMLKSLAEQTAGRAIVNRNDLAGALAQVSRDASAYYLLGFVSAHPTDGKFHKIAIRVKRRGVTVRARAGYLAFKGDDVRTETAPAVPAEIDKALARLAEQLRPAGDELILPRRAFESAAANTSASVGTPPLVGAPSFVVLHGLQPEERAVRPEFARSQRVAVRALIPTDAPPALTATLLGRTGQELAKLPVTVTPGRAETTLALANVGPGDYVVRLVAERGGDLTEQYIALRVLR
ncbi:MAG TPA: VWA domain-containing protein [Vicinamibacterales bacterium]|nr:VWA domain-containing protein [Vicinamibacterales bacterium]